MNKNSFPLARRPGLHYNRRVPDSAGSSINATTRLCAVYGHPIKHSASPAMHNAGLAALGLNWRYLAFDVAPGELRAAIAGAKAMKFIGLNLTVPHKLLALDLVDELDATAKTWGAVNTIRFETRVADGGWRPLAEVATDDANELRAVGFNTDADAVVRAIGEDLKLELRGARVLFLGAGGAGRVGALRLAAEGVGELALVNRTASKAVELAKEIRQRFPMCGVSVGYPAGKVDLVVNATSLGLKPDDGLPFDQNQFALTDAGAVFDMIYRPAETPLLRAARLAGCRIANGLGMLLHQGARALEIWCGQPAPVAVMRCVLEENIYGK
ncbi:MAG: shikimate dehydrogenase [Verrucomicrobia bacterium]|nr:shikimate dehydrogenase [Verrucomicrobiota bacterium]